MIVHKWLKLSKQELWYTKSSVLWQRQHKTKLNINITRISAEPIKTWTSEEEANGQRNWALLTLPPACFSRPS